MSGKAEKPEPGSLSRGGATIEVPSQVPAPEEKKDLSPNELADMILGVVDQHAGDENFDLNEMQFWHRAAYQKDISRLMKEKNRLKTLIGDLQKRGYDERLINQIFSRVKRAQSECSKTEKRRQIELQLLKLCGAAVAVFLLVVVVPRIWKLARERKEEILLATKFLKIEAGNTSVKYTEPLGATWEPLPVQNPIVREGSRVKTEKGTHRIELPGGDFVTIEGKAELQIRNLNLDLKSRKIVSVTIHLLNGFFEWSKQDSSYSLNFSFQGGSLVVGYGQGKFELGNNSSRVAVLDGENRITLDRDLPRPFNGLMHLLISEGGPELGTFDRY